MQLPKTLSLCLDVELVEGVIEEKKNIEKKEKLGLQNPFIFQYTKPTSILSLREQNHSKLLYP